MIDIMTLAHLHKNRFTVHSQKTNLIEAGPNMEFEQQPEWYYNVEGTSAVKKEGPVTFKQVRFLK